LTEPQKPLQPADTTALLRQEQKSFETEGQHQRGGILVRARLCGGLRVDVPVMVSITFRIEGEQITAADLYTLPGRFSISRPTLTSPPRKMKLACRFFNVPPAAKQVFEKVFRVAAMQEKLLHSKGNYVWPMMSMTAAMMAGGSILTSRRRVS
jgi:hypothetical protein